MIAPSESYGPIIGLALKEQPLPKSPLPVLLMDGSTLSGITPHSFVIIRSGDPRKGADTLSLLYEDKNNKPATVNVGRISGLEVVTFVASFTSKRPIIGQWITHLNPSHDY